MINLKPSAADRAAAEKVLAALEAKPGFNARKALLQALATLVAANKKAASGDTVKLKDGTVFRVDRSRGSTSIYINGQRVYRIGGP